MIFKKVAPRKSRKAAARRRQRIFLLSAALAVATAFAAGYFWKSRALRALRTPDPRTSAATEERRKALAAMDDALRAKFEKRMAGRLAALDRARHDDPQAPALDILFAEAALESRQFDEMRAAATRARAKGDHIAGAELLFGLDKWINRGSGDRELATSSANAAIHFTASTEADFAFASAWFFWGDVLRYAGNEAEGRARALSALHRFNPWDSSDVIAAKATFASAEAGNSALGALPFLPDSPWTRAAANLASRRQTGETPAPESLTPFGAQPAIRALVTDRIFKVGSAFSHDGKNKPPGSPPNQP